MSIKYFGCVLTVISAEMSVMVKDHESQLAQLKDASEKELLKVQQENYVLSVVRRTCSFLF